MSRALVLIVALSACGRRGSLYEAELAPLPLVTTSSAVVQVVPQTNRAVVVRPGQARPSAVLVSSGARLATRVPGREVVAILSGSARAPTLDLVDLEANTIDTIEAPGAFDRMTFSPEGAFGILTYDASRSAGLAARNLNELALLNVGDATLTRISLDTEGVAPRFVQFAPAVGGRRLVAIALDRGLALFDALRPNVPPRRIALRPPGSTSDAGVLEFVFSRDTRWLFVRTLGVDDVVAIELGPEVGAPPSASINFIAGGVGLADLELAPESAGDGVLAVYSTSQEAFLLDARGIQDNQRRVGLPAAFTQVAPIGPGRVLLWAPSTRAVLVWDVLDGRTGVATLAGLPDRSWPLPALGRAALLLPAIDSSAAALDTLSVTEDPNRLRVRVQTVQLARKPTAFTFSDDQELLFAAVPQPAGLPAVVTVELRSLALSEIVLDVPITGLAHLANGGQLVAEHASPFGDLSVMPAGAVDRLAVTRFSDFALTGALDRPEDGR